MSRCEMFFSCKYLKASASARIIFLEFFYDALYPGWSLRYEFREIPERNYMIRLT